MDQKSVEYCLGSIISSLVDQYGSNEQEKKFIRLAVFYEVRNFILNHNFNGKL